MMVRDFQSVIGDEARAQFLEQAGALPDLLVACVGGGSNAIGLFHAFLDDPVEMVGVEAGGRSARAGDHAARFLGRGRRRWACCTARAPTCCRTRRATSCPRTRSPPASTIPAVGPEHALLRDRGRVRYAAASDDEALAAFRLLARTEGHHPRPGVVPRPGLGGARSARPSPGRRVLVNLSGRGDKDLAGRWRPR